MQHQAALDLQRLLHHTCAELDSGPRLPLSPGDILFETCRLVTWSLQGVIEEGRVQRERSGLNMTRGLDLTMRSGFEHGIARDEDKGLGELGWRGA